MSTILLAALLQCKTALIGFDTLSEAEKTWIKNAKAECPKRNKDKPCLVQYIKKEPGKYRAICGKNNVK